MAIENHILYLSWMTKDIDIFNKWNIFNKLLFPFLFYIKHYKNINSIKILKYSSYKVKKYIITPLL